MVKPLPEYYETPAKIAYGPIRAMFTLTELPTEIDAPPEIAEAWLGVDIPVRAYLIGIGAALLDYNLNEVTHHLQEEDAQIAIAGIDVMFALERYGRLKAAEYWAPHGFSILNLAAHEGIIQPLPQQLVA